ncbi:MAG: uroporphyrinogen decarboxylase family protein, partial [Candidatus Poribacteria bacterium]
FVEKQLEMGLDATVDLPMTPLDVEFGSSDLRGLPIRYHPEVKIHEWREEKTGEQYPVLVKEYHTPGGILSTMVNQTDDWPHGDHVPFLDDYLIPRSKKFLVENRKDLEVLRCLLVPPTADDIRTFREDAQKAKNFASKHGLLVTGGRGVGIEAASWLYGLQNIIIAAMDEPEFVEEFADLLYDWNRQRMEVFLDAGVDLFIRRGWYEGTDFWSPRLYRRFIFPYLKKEIEMAHQAGAKFGYIMTSGSMPLLDMFVESELDALIGVDPIQGKGTDLSMMKRKLKGKVCLWGGVNGFITVERGSKTEVREAVLNAIKTLAPGGGFILSPVDNIRDTSEETWKNVMAMLEAWKEMREYPIA